MDNETLQQVNPIGRMDVLVYKTLGVFTSAIETAAQVPQGTFATFVNPYIEQFARTQFGGKRK